MQKQQSVRVIIVGGGFALIANVGSNLCDLRPAICDRLTGSLVTMFLTRRLTILPIRANVGSGVQ
jgi:hypothetical protein